MTGKTCREYVRQRGNMGGARRDLEDLRAAIEHHTKEGLHRGRVRVTLPQKGPPRDRSLTLEEIAAILRACWRYREVQTIHRGSRARQTQQTEKRPLRHLARFILIAIYTGSRAGAVLTASPYRGDGRSYVDLEAGIFYRLAEGSRETNKATPFANPAETVGASETMDRHRVYQAIFRKWNRQPTRSVKTAFKTAIRLAGVRGRVSPHTLRHTAATWLMQMASINGKPWVPRKCLSDA